jgi:hypothetical protein
MIPSATALTRMPRAAYSIASDLVHPGHRVVVLVGVVGERLGDEHSGIVDQGVDPAEPVQGMFDDVRAGARPGQVPRHREHFGVGAVDGAGGRDHGVAELAVGGNQARADAAGRAGDDGDFLSGVHYQRPAFGSGSAIREQ